MRARPIGRPGELALLAAGAAAWTAVLRRPRGARPPQPPREEAPPPPDRRWKAILKAAGKRWLESDISRRAAALSYYTIFSMAPLILIVLSVVGLFFGDEAAQKIVEGRFQGFLGEDQAGVVLDMIRSKSKEKAQGAAAAVVGFLTLILGATVVVGELQSSLDSLWKLPPRRGGLWGNVKSRLLSLGFILSMGFLLLVSLLLSTAVSALGAYLQGWLPASELMLQALNFAVSFAVTSCLFALMYRFLPNARIPWRQVFVGGAVTSLLFTAGNLLLGLYLGKGGPTSVYGAAGSLLAVFLWAYYNAQILYFGAEVTKSYAEARS